MKNLKMFFANVIPFINVIGKELKTLAIVTLKITGNIKKVLKEPVTKAVIELVLPKEIQDLIPNVDNVLAVAINTLHNVTGESPLNETQTIVHFIKELKTKPTFVQNALLQKLAGIILMILDKSKHKEKEYQIVTDTLLAHSNL